MNNIKLALFEPEIPQNVGSLIRTCACFNTQIILIEPFNFFLEDRSFKRAKMDYETSIEIYPSFDVFMEKEKGRKVLFTPHCSQSIVDFKFENNDVLLFGRESNGVEDHIAAQTDVMVSIPMVKNCRSLNLAISSAIGLTFALQSVNKFKFN